MTKYIVFLKTDYEDTRNTWWLKGEYEGESPEEVVNQLYAKTYLTPNRGGNPRRVDRVALTGPGTVWREFDVTIEAVPAKLISVVAVPFKRDED